MTFRFCVNELLTHLHKDASRNIVFCFTNARSTFYRPGDTLPTLQKLMQENKSVTIPLNKSTMYCLDNEAFRFLCALQQKVEFSPADVNNFAISWDTSVAETSRLFEHIANLQPHQLNQTISLNRTRRLIISLTQPMAEIVQNIEVNLELIKDRKKILESNKLSQADLQKKAQCSFHRS